ncbi:heme-binding domain-containing protein [Dyadobacter subterraneus]|uniref:Heme-binding domain-containing protein n=1 Tax=Dyadobacter subterraneus TaxID=2773304 RepID=A0ABR9WG94_9BACT|nr:heme-binding domain-containing protein [Dyadobacter subterraneus]MBE9464447.1 heme-binding domain-containing protein [Dyadobacter subterraneus]
MSTSQQNSYKRKAVVLLAILFVAFIGFQATSPDISERPVTGEFKGPEDVANIFKRSCYDCHSNETNLNWYDKIAPFSHIVAADVNKARKRFNFSEWDSIPKADQEAKLWYMVNMIDAKKMPLPSYTAIHPAAKVSDKELVILKNYVTGLSAKIHEKGDTATIKKSEHNAPTNHTAQSNNFPESVNGIRYFDDYKNWKVISSTNRFDNGTMRLIYGNDIAVKAIKEDKIKPWPNGAIIVKVVWNSQHEDKNGNISTGNFNNVQMMIRDDKKFKATEGWGFARFSGLDLVPYGKTISFATSCINCHKLVPENGFVFDIPTKK